MLAIAGAPMGVRLKALDPTERAPASIAATQVVGSFRDKGGGEGVRGDVRCGDGGD
jgi:phosphoribosylaminoimidazole carboxylase (NCAIR synthetase)